MSQSDPVLIKITFEVAKTFVLNYYNALDHNRGSLAGFYQPDASIVWNGNPLAGGEAFSHFFATMPVSIYDVHSYDAHPIGNDVSPAMVMMTVSGSVKYGEGSKEQRGFSETIVLVQEEHQHGQGRPKFKIGSQAFRLVSA